MSQPTERRWWFGLFYVFLPIALAIAAIILGRYTWQTATQYARLGEETIVESTLLVVREKVNRIERLVIDADNVALAQVNLDNPQAIEITWRPRAAELTPSVRALMVLDSEEQVQGYSIRGDELDRWSFLHLFRERILPKLELDQLSPGRLKHLHESFAGRSYLLSYKAIDHRGSRFYLVAHHDTGFLLREHIANLFSSEDREAQYNVVDEQTNRIIYGRNLAQAGDYLVGMRFPTTLYSWRLQVAPKRAPQLETQRRSRRVTEAVLIGTSFFVILFGIISLLYAATRERQLNELKSEFIANVSHELKTPLSVVRMFGEMLLSGRVRTEEKRQQYLEIIVRESERLSALIENVLDFAALERGKQKYDLREGDFTEAVRKAIDSFRYRVEHEGIEVTLVAPPGLPRVDFDEQGIMLAVINLLDNAVKYGGRTPIDVRLDVRERWVEVHVRDRGPGIPEEHRRRVFDRFFRTQQDKAQRGSGIGLSLVKHIAETHGGRAWATNAADGGAIVSFSVAVRTQRPRRTTPPPAGSPDAL